MAEIWLGIESAQRFAEYLLTKVQILPANRCIKLLLRCSAANVENSVSIT